ncbi:MAG: ABC transporter permease subunit [Ilumatobacteraceae bacterium]
MPGTIFLVIFALYPVLYTVYISTTNYGTGNNLDRATAIAQLEAQSVASSDGAIRYELQILAQGDVDGPLAFLLTDPNGNRFLGTDAGLEPLDPSQIIADGRRETIAGYVALNTGEAQDRVDEVTSIAVPTDQGEVVNDGFRAAFAKLQRLQYDSATNTMRDVVDGTEYTVESGYFVAPDGTRLLPGWRANVGLDNYQRLISTSSVRGEFLRVFVWTLVFSIMSVVLSFALGMFLALVFNNPKMRAQKLYRSLIIIPYALPSFMTALVWKGMLNTQFGIVNRMLGVSIPWLDGQWMPYVSILLVNTWLGYPYMFLICTGALQSIPGDLNEAAIVDGASGVARFRRVTFPLLLIAVAPLLVASFAFNFNNFNLIYLLTEGKPSVLGSNAGRTDILISFTYKLAFGGGRGADYGYAATISFIIFMIVAGISAFSFRFTRRLEEIRR